jgi:exodeoxyribonuclease VII large subunit
VSDLFTQVIEKPLVSELLEGDNFLNKESKAKELTPQIDWIVTQRKIQYLDSLILLRNHKSIQVRRKTATALGLLGDSQLVQNLKEWQVHESDRQTWLILESSIDRILRRKDGVVETITTRIYSVAEAINQIKRQISEKTYTIEGEISEPKLNRQMYYFGLKDSSEIRLDCMAFVGRIVKMGFPLNEGLTVRIVGKFKLSKTSRIYVDVENIELTGEGELLRNLKMLEEKLQREGLFDQTRKRPIPKIPENILLLASPNSAAIDDFGKVLNQRIGGKTIYLLPIKTQGVGAEYEILESLRATNDIIDKYKINTVVITRGGGSKDDLFVFNSEKIVRAINALKAPTIVAIGHERDITLSELVADLRASTPSQAAELISLSRDEILNQTNYINQRLWSFFGEKQKAYNSTANQLWFLSSRPVYLKIQQSKNSIQSINQYLTNILTEIKTQTSYIINKTKSLIQQRIWENKLTLKNFSSTSALVQNNLVATHLFAKNLQQKISLESLAIMEKYKTDFNLVVIKIDSYNPQKILEKGYALIIQKGKIIDVSTKLDLKKSFKIKFSDKEIEVLD